jgi:hypothetical protein
MVTCSSNSIFVLCFPSFAHEVVSPSFSMQYNSSVVLLCDVCLDLVMFVFIQYSVVMFVLIL